MADQTQNQIGGLSNNGVISAFRNIVNPGGGGGSVISSADWSLGSLINVSEYYPHFVNSGLVGSYKIFICDNTGSKDIFTEYQEGYRISVTLTATEFPYLNKPSSYGGFIDVEFGIGFLPVITKKLKVTKDDKFVEFSFFYQPTDFDLRKTGGRNMWVRKVTPGILKIVDSKVESIVVAYETDLNNTLYLSSLGSNNFFTLPAENNGKSILLNIGNKGGEVTSIKFGNGRFKKGIWKTGVWNDGWRALWDGQEDLFFFEKINLNSFQLSPNMWMLKIDCNTNPDNVLNIIDNLNVNDFISLSNVVGIDLNEERYLLKDYYRISAIDTDGSLVTLTIEIPVAKFPLRRFEVDSNTHLIYVTKNIWLGGTFLNGYFRGVWNYGLFKGYPYTTVMEDSHFVDGKFDGGRFISNISSITQSNSEAREYHTGLVQFFEFYDNNISETEGFSNYIDNTYQSWIDVNYYTQSFVNLSSLTSVYDENFGKKVPIPNLYGYPTLDVLSSYSKFKNTTDSDVDYYNLGTKYKIFTDHLEDNGYFRKAFNSEGKPGLEEFMGAGWTANTGNFYGTPTVSFIYNSNIVRRNVNRMSIILATFGYNVLNNNNIRVDDKKYTVVEYDLEYFQRGRDENTGEFTNTFSKPLNLLGSNYPSTTNIYKSGIIKTEYFFNKNALDLILRYNSEYSPPRESIAMYGFNYTYSNNTGETNPSYSTTYSFIMPETSAGYSSNDIVPDFDVTANVAYGKYDIVRRATGDALGPYFISLTGSNTSPLTDTSAWAKTTVGFNNPKFESTTFEQSEIFDFFTSVRINYFKFLEIDALPFFKYWDYEINFTSTFKDAINATKVSLEFPKPHGLKVGDFISLKLDETKFNSDYEQSSGPLMAIHSL
jgi:hypothetical protein